MAIPYVKQTWTDWSGGGTPVSAARLGVIEQGIFDAQRMPCARAFHNANQALTTGTLTALAFNSERYDTDTIHDNATNNSRLTCKTAGVYSIIGNVEFAANAAGVRQAQIRLNGTTYIGSTLALNTGAGIPTKVVVATHYQLAVNDYVELIAYQDSGGNLNVNVTGNYSPEFMMVRVAT